MWKNVKAVFTGLLTIIVLVAGGAGCSGQVSGQVSAEAESPFITDRVVTVRIVMEEADWAACQENPLAEQYVKADFWFDGELVPDVAVRPKGNSSLQQAARSRSPRFSLKVDFNLFNAARNFRGLKKVNLNNGWSDPTLIRERLAYELFEQMGIPTPRAAHVDLWVNDTHLGVYTMVEQVDQTFLRQHFTDATGNLYKPEIMAAALDWTEADIEEQQARLGDTDEPDNVLDINLGGGRLGDIMRALGQQESDTGNAPSPLAPDRLPLPGAALGQPRDYLEAVGLKTNENNPDHSALLHFLDVLNNEPDETFPAEIEKVLDVDGVLRFLAVSALIVHLDNYIGLGHNYYLYEVDGKFSIIPWDLNMAFGTFNCGFTRERLINFYIDEPTGGAVANRPLVARLLSHQPYLDTYHGYLESLLDGPFPVAVMEPRIDQLADLIRPFVEKDELKFFSTEEFERSLSEDLRRSLPGVGRLPDGAPRQPPGLPGFQPSAIGLKTFVRERSTSVRQQLAGVRPSGPGDGSGNGATSGLCGGDNRNPFRFPGR